jgi:hypothetical protein
MRQFLAVTLLGASLAFTAGAAFASDRVDYHPPFQPAQTVATENPVEPVQSTVAGDAAPQSVYGESRYENYGQ